MPDIHIPALAISLDCKELRVLVCRSAVSGLALGSRIQVSQTDFRLVGFEVSDDDPDFVWLDLERLCPSRTVQLNLFDHALGVKDLQK